MDVNQTVVKVPEKIGVDHVFGGSGQVNGSMLPALKKSDKIKTVIIQNEQAASFMAAGYAMFSKKLGVCFATAVRMLSTNQQDFRVRPIHKQCSPRRQKICNFGRPA